MGALLPFPYSEAEFQALTRSANVLKDSCRRLGFRGDDGGIDRVKQPCFSARCSWSAF